MRFDYIFDAFRATDESSEVVRRQLAALEAALPEAISVVGNASSLLDRHHGAEIDRHATIRFNQAQIVDPAAQGSRWDFVATSNAKVLEYYRLHEPRFSTLIFTAYLDMHRRALDALGSPRPVLDYPIRLSRELSFKCRARPTTGMQVLYLLDRLGARQVSIFGFDWKATPTYYDPDRRKDPHNHIRERRLALEMIARNGWQVHQ